MTFRVDMLFLYISLWILFQYDTNARTLEWPKQIENLGFSWGNCGPGTDSIKIISLSIGPDPIRLPGNVIISTSVNITKPFPADIHAKVYMEKYIAGLYIKVPCEHNVGSCTYSVCTNQTASYPSLFNTSNPPMKCPAVPPAIYSVANLVMDVTKSIPSIADGGFRITIDFISNYAGHLACLKLGVNLKN